MEKLEADIKKLTQDLEEKDAEYQKLQDRVTGYLSKIKALQENGLHFNDKEM